MGRVPYIISGENRTVTEKYRYYSCVLALYINKSIPGTNPAVAWVRGSIMR